MNDMTPAQVQRDEFLRRLATIPIEGLRYWNRISQAERITVITYMTISYDQTFAQLFKLEADKRTRPANTIHVTNDPRVTPAFLTSKGFARSKRQGGTAVIWVHPNGNEVWVLPPPRGGTPAPEPDPTKVGSGPVKPDPYVEEAQLYINEFTADKNDLIRRAFEIAARRNSMSKEEFDKLQAEWWRDQDKFTSEVQEKINSFNDIPDLSENDKKLLQKAISELESTRSSWPNPWNN